MARGNSVAVILIAAFLGMVAVGLSFAAYATRIKVSDVSSVNGNCLYANKPAFALGIVAAVFLLMEQVVVSAGTDCFCCCGTRCHSSCAYISSIILFILSWATFIIAFLGLISSAILNNSGLLTNATTGKYGDLTETLGDGCYVGKDNYFLGAAIWCIISIVLGLLSLIIVRTSDNRNNPRPANFAHEEGVALGQPAKY